MGIVSWGIRRFILIYCEDGWYFMGNMVIMTCYNHPIMGFDGIINIIMRERWFYDGFVLATVRFTCCSRQIITNGMWDMIQYNK